MKVVSAFPCCGKSKLFEDMGGEEKGIYDSDSSKFSWIERIRTASELLELKKQWESTPHLLSGEGYINKIKDELIKVREPNFPQNYMDHLKSIMDDANVIFVSSHQTVRDALAQNNIQYVLVFPENTYTNKAEWIGRAALRGSDSKFLDVLSYNWDSWIQSCIDDNNAAEKYILKENEFLADYIGKILFLEAK